MRSLFSLLLLVLILGLVVIPGQRVMAQATTLNDTVSYAVGDTMYVAWAHTNWTPRKNALRSTIMGDTVVGGARANANRVYKLKVDGWYWEVDDIVNTFPLKIVADPMKLIPAGHYPPILQMADTRDDGTGGANHILTAGDDVTLKNLWISGRTTVSNARPYQPILFNANNKHYVIDGCVFENSNFALVVFTGANNECYVTNNVFQNLQEEPVTQQWTGRGVSIWADQDSVIMENNTFFNIGFATFQMEGGAAKYLRYNHNTIIGCGRSLMSGSGDWWQDAYFANNLIINGWWEGERWNDVHGSGRDPRQLHDGLFHIGILPASYGPEQKRRVVIYKNYAYLDPLIKAKYGTGSGPDSITRAWFMDNVSGLDYSIPYAVGGANNGHMYVSDTSWLTSLPTGFTNYLTDANWQKPLYNVSGATMVDSMWSYITAIYNGVTGGTRLYYHPTSLYTDQSWPLSFSGAYTDAALKVAGSDGLPIGDLNWFPTEKATFLANQAANVAAIENKAGAVVHFPIDSTAEAENGAVSGTAAVAAVQGLTYYDYNGSGSITWNFNITNPGEYDMRWYVNGTGRGNSGPVIGINGTQIHDKAHMWGQFIFDVASGPMWGMSNNSWIWVKITADSVGGAASWSPGDSAAFTLSAGPNTIAVLNGGWGEMYFAEVDIWKRGTTDTIKLKAPDAIPALVKPGAVGVTWVASGFKYVNMGSGGTVTWTFPSVTGGTYHLRTFYQNTGSTQSVVIKDGSTTLKTESFSGLAAGTGLDNFSGSFTLSPGSHTLSVTGANINVDYVQLIKEVVGAVGKNGLPTEYSLDQNYPNPFNPSTTIRFSLGAISNVKLRVYNLLGQQVLTLLDTRMNPGPHAVVFDAGKLSTGVYFYRLEAGPFSSVKKMLLIK